MAKKTLYEFSVTGPGSLSDVLLVEVNRDWCREGGTLAATTVDLPVGAVLAKNDDGDYVPFLAAPGDNQAVAMLIKAAPASAAKQHVSVIRRGAVVAFSGLGFLTAVTEEQQKTACGQLTSLGIVVQN